MTLNVFNFDIDGQSIKTYVFRIPSARMHEKHPRNPLISLTSETQSIQSKVPSKLVIYNKEKPPKYSAPGLHMITTFLLMNESKYRSNLGGAGPITDKQIAERQ